LVESSTILGYGYPMPLLTGAHF